MMKAIVYVYYRIKKINPNYGNAIISIQFSAIVLINLMPLIQIMDELLGSTVFEGFWSLVANDDVVTRRMIKLPILFSPLFVSIYLFLGRNNERILEGCKKLELMPKEILRKKNFYLWLYIIGSFVFLALGITSLDWVPKTK